MQLQSWLWSYSVPASSTRQIDFTFDESAHIGRRFKMLNDICKSKPVGGRYVKPTRDKILKLLDVSFESYLADPKFRRGRGIRQAHRSPKSSDDEY